MEQKTVRGKTYYLLGLDDKNQEIYLTLPYRETFETSEGKRSEWNMESFLCKLIKENEETMFQSIFYVFGDPNDELNNGFIKEISLNRHKNIKAISQKLLEYKRCFLETTKSTSKQKLWLKNEIKLPIIIEELKILLGEENIFERKGGYFIGISEIYPNSECFLLKPKYVSNGIYGKNWETPSYYEKQNDYKIRPLGSERLSNYRLFCLDKFIPDSITMTEYEREVFCDFVENYYVACDYVKTLKKGCLSEENKDIIQKIEEEHIPKLWKAMVILLTRNKRNHDVLKKRVLMQKLKMLSDKEILKINNYIINPNPNTLKGKTFPLDDKETMAKILKSIPDEDFENGRIDLRANYIYFGLDGHAKSLRMKEVEYEDILERLLEDKEFAKEIASLCLYPNLMDF